MSGLMPTYKFVPNPSSAEPNLRSYSNRRARLTLGGTYFRARKAGATGNLLSVEVLEITPPSASNHEAYCVITNHEPLASENIDGNLTAPILSLKGTYADLWKFENLNTTPTAHYYSISLRIAFRIQQGESYDLDVDPENEVQHELIGPAPLGTFYSSPKISIKTASGASPGGANTTAFVKNRQRIYRLSTTNSVASTSSEAPASTSKVWDVLNLRAQVNASNPWVEMPARSSDVQDDGEDNLETGLRPFARTNLTSGDGLPLSPNRESTGPTRAVVHLNYGEEPNGKLVEMNEVYEWAGESSSNGSWVRY